MEEDEMGGSHGTDGEKRETLRKETNWKMGR